MTEKYNLEIVAIFYLKIDSTANDEKDYFAQQLAERITAKMTTTQIVSGSASVKTVGKDYCQIRIDVIRSKFEPGVPKLDDIILLDIHLKKWFRFINLPSKKVKASTILAEYRDMVFHREQGHSD